MNDIEILEELRHELGLYANGEKVRQGQAIENLIQRNKDLEQIEKEHKEENGRLREENKKLQEFYEKYYDSINSELNGLLTHKFIGYIPISKIKEKYLNMEREYSKKVYDKKYNRKEVKKEEFYKRQVYKELLEESEK